MKYNVKYNKETGICFVQVTGIVRRPEDSIKLQKVALKYTNKSGYSRFLFDMRRAKIISDTMKTFKTGIAPQIHGLRLHGNKAVLVYSGDIIEHKFMETVLVNRGYDIRVTDNIEEAKALLIK